MKRLGIVVLALVVLVAGGAALALRSPVPGERVTVEIVRGSSTQAVGALLERSGVIASKDVFRIAAKILAVDGKIQSGRYELRKNMGVRAAIEALERAPLDEYVAVSIPEGYTVRQIAAKVEARTSVRGFAAAATGATVRPSIVPANVNSLEGVLFPETYRVRPDEKAAALVQRMVAEFESKFATLDMSVPRSKGLSPYQIVVMASLIEREAKVAEDRARVAAVIYNRLAKGMPLQIDATSLYDLPAHKVPTRADLQRPSPYNTYLNKGLPPTPIASPGFDALAAAVSPAPISALYYVVVDPSGRHGFSDTLQEHNRRIAQARRR